MGQVSVLIVDDEPVVRVVLCRTISRFRPDWRVEAVADPRAANEALKRTPYRVIVCDHHLETSKGADYLRELATTHPQMVRILTSGRPDAEQESAGCSHAFFAKPPSSPKELIELIEHLVGSE